MGFSGPEYQGGWHFPSPGDLPKPGIKPRYHIAGGFLTRLATREETSDRVPLRREVREADGDAVKFLLSHLA